MSPNPKPPQVEMVAVGDDCALPHISPLTGRRGIAGSILVLKVAGAAAAAGNDLTTVHAAAQAGLLSLRPHVATAAEPAR